MNRKLNSIKKWFALSVCVLFAAASLLSAAYVYARVNHKHDHNSIEESCAVCVHLSAAKNLYKYLSAALIGAAFILACLSVYRPALAPGGFRMRFFTPVSLKVRLNN